MRFVQIRIWRHETETEIELPVFVLVVEIRAEAADAVVGRCLNPPMRMKTAARIL